MQKLLMSGVALATLVASSQALADSKEFNFAFGGAQSGDQNLTALFESTLPPAAATQGLVVPGLAQEMDWFEAEVRHVHEDDMVWLWVGTNDVLGAVLSGQPDLIFPALTALGDNVSGAMNRVAARGAKYIVVPNLVPTGKLPILPFVAGLSPEQLAGIDAITAFYNYQVLPGVLEQFSASHPDVTVIPVDIAAVTEYLYANSGLVTAVPCQFAVPPEVGAAGCAPFFFVDLVHPTETVYAAWADAAADAIRTAVPPSCGGARFKRMIVLGDSFSDKGSFDYVWNTSLPDRDPFLPDNFFPLNRFSNGLNVIDFLEQAEFASGQRMVKEGKESKPYLQGHKVKTGKKNK